MFKIRLVIRTTNLFIVLDDLWTHTCIRYLAIRYLLMRWRRSLYRKLPLPTSFGSRQAKMCLRACAKCTDSDSCHAQILIWAFCSPLMHSIVSSNSVSGPRSSWSDCADTQANLVLCCSKTRLRMAWHTLYWFVRYLKPDDKALFYGSKFHVHLS